MPDDPAQPGDPAALPYDPRMSRLLPVLHRAFLVANRRLALPVLHAGLAPFWSLPAGRCPPPGTYRSCGPGAAPPARFARRRSAT